MANETIEADAIHFPVRDDAEAEDAKGGYARVEGTAVASERGAAVRAGTFVVEVPDTPAWPDDVVGEIVVVRGRLVQTEHGWAMESSLYEVKDS